MPKESEVLLAQAQAAVNDKYRQYETLSAGHPGRVPG